METRVLVLGAGGAVWKRKIERSLINLKGKLENESDPCTLNVWGADVSGNLPNSSLVNRWFCVDDPDDMRELIVELDNGKVQVAIIASPNETHVPYLILLLGKVDHIIVEKPLAEEVIEADLAVVLAQSSTLTTCWGLDHYVSKPQARVALRMAQSGDLTKLIGEIKHVHFSMREKDPIDPKRAGTLRRGLAFDMAIHGFAFLLRLFDRKSADDIRILQASVAKYRGAPIDGETATRIELAVLNGPTCTIDIGKGLAGKDEKWIVIRGAKDTLTVDLDQKTVFLKSGAKIGSLPSPVMGKEMLELVKAEARQIVDDAYDIALCEPIRRSCGLHVDPEDARWLVEISLAANALKLVERARARFEVVEPYIAGTMPRIFSHSALLGGAYIEVCPTQEDLERAALRLMLSEAEMAIDRVGSFVLIVPGGTSLLGVTRCLATNQFRNVDLSKWQIFFSDEHSLPHSDPGNNHWLAKERGGWGDLIAQGRLQFGQLHQMIVEDAAGQPLTTAPLLEARIHDYTDAYRNLLGSRTGADVAFLGLGTDCHTASILPQKENFENPLFQARSAFSVVDYPESYRGTDRLRSSITLAGIADARKVVLIAFGEKKSAAVKDVLTGSIDLERKPGSVIRLVGGTVLTDVAGATGLQDQIA